MFRRIVSIGLAVFLALPLDLLASPASARSSHALSSGVFAQTALQPSLIVSPLRAIAYEPKVQVLERVRAEFMPVPHTPVGLLLTTSIDQPQGLWRSLNQPVYDELLRRYSHLKMLMDQNLAHELQRVLLTEVAPYAEVGFHFAAPVMALILQIRNEEATKQIAGEAPTYSQDIRDRVHNETVGLARQYAKAHKRAFLDSPATNALTFRDLAQRELDMLAAEVGMWLAGLEALADARILTPRFSPDQLQDDIYREEMRLAEEYATYSRAVYERRPGYAYKPYAVAYATAWGSLLRISFTAPKRLKTVTSERYFDDLFAKYPRLWDVLDDIPALQALITDVIAPKEETELLFINPMVKMVLDLQKSRLSHEFLLFIVLQKLEHIAIDAAAMHSLAVIPIDKAPYYKIVNLSRQRQYALMNTFHSWYAPEGLHFMPMIIENWGVRDVRAFLGQLLAEKLEALHAAVNRNVRRQATGFRNSPYLTLIAA